MYNIDYVYDQGEDVTQDFTEALKWYRETAKKIIDMRCTTLVLYTRVLNKLIKP